MKQRYKVKSIMIDGKKMFIIYDNHTKKSVGSIITTKGHAESLAMVWNEIQRDLRKPF